MQSSSSTRGARSHLTLTQSSFLASARRFLAVPALCLPSLCLAACASDADGIDATEDLGRDLEHASDVEIENEPGAAEDPPAPNEDAELASAPQALTSGCTLLRPLSWYGRGVTCLEKPNTPLSMANGQVYRAYSGVEGIIYGVGEARVRCTNGRIVQEYATCQPGGGPLP